jgi:hypothetical protein
VRAGEPAALRPAGNGCAGPGPVGSASSQPHTTVAGYRYHWRTTTDPTRTACSSPGTPSRFDVCGGGRGSEAAGR